MKGFKIYILLFIFSAVGTSPGLPGDFFSNPYWDSGKAEFQVYDARINKYGVMRDAKVKIIMVKEPFDMEKLVKTMSNKGAEEVIKMNYIQTVPTGVYDYFQTATIFFNRKTGQVIKYTMGSQDGCGNTFMEYLLKDGRHKFTFHSYFDDQGDADVYMAKEDFVFYDALPVTLRTKLGQSGNYSILLANSFISKQAVPIQFKKAEVSVTRLPKVKIKGDIYKGAYKAEVTCEKRSDKLYFEKDFPHRMLKWEKSNGDSLILKGSNFFYYWEHTNPEDGKIFNKR